MPHPVNRLSTHCITSMATLLLSERSSQEGPDTLYAHVQVTDQGLVAEATSSYRTTLRATEILTLIVARPTPSPQGILYLVVPVHFMQEATSSLPLILKYSSRQQLRQTNKTLWFRLPILGIFFTDREAFLGLKINAANSNTTPAIHSVELSQGDLSKTLPFINLNNKFNKSDSFSNPGFYFLLLFFN